MDDEGVQKELAAGIAEFEINGTSSGMLEQVEELREGDRDRAAPGVREGDPPPDTCS